MYPSTGIVRRLLGKTIRNGHGRLFGRVIALFSNAKNEVTPTTPTTSATSVRINTESPSSYSDTDAVKRFLGKTIRDEYGRVFGRVIGLFNNAKDEVASVGIELSNGGFSRYPRPQISVKGDSAVFIYAWKVASSAIWDEFSATRRKISALDKLYSDKEISKDIYGEMRGKNEVTINELVERREALVDDLQVRVKRLDAQIRGIQAFVADVKIERIVGEIDEESYKISSNAVQTELNRVSAEKKDIETTINRISNVHMIPLTSESAPKAPDIVKPPTSAHPIALRVKR